MKITKIAKSTISKMPGLKKLYSIFMTLKNINNPFLHFKPPGHFYSPIPDINYIRKNRAQIFAQDRASCPAINLLARKQIDLVRSLASYYDQMPFSKKKQDGFRYYFCNDSYGHGSSIVLFSLMLHFQPKRIVEVGSGYSSAAMLDVNDRFFDGSIKFTFVEPYPERLFSLITNEDRKSHDVHVDIAQNLPHTIYTDLKCNDILFIDSSHVAKIGSDVVYLLTEILPILQKGVIIHIHDIYWPFEYPEDWVLEGIAWNEAYFVKAFLQFNDAFNILLFNSYLATHHQALMKECLPLFLPDSGSSLWIRKTL